MEDAKGMDTWEKEGILLRICQANSKPLRTVIFLCGSLCCKYCETFEKHSLTITITNHNHNSLHIGIVIAEVNKTYKLSLVVTAAFLHNSSPLYLSLYKWTTGKLLPLHIHPFWNSLILSYSKTLADCIMHIAFDVCVCVNVCVCKYAGYRYWFPVNVLLCALAGYLWVILCSSCEWICVVAQRSPDECMPYLVTEV